MKYLSLFSGIEAAAVAWTPLGWECVAMSEIDRFPCDLLSHHYPDVPNLGDIRNIGDRDVALLGSIDLVVGGSPCQDLSVAGNRKGLKGERSKLFHEQIRIFHAARAFCGARHLLWENVPGAFSSNGGRDFAVVVGEMAGADLPVPRNGWKNSGVALGRNGLVEWRVLDAQYVRVEPFPRAVPQSRRRVFALLDTGDWRSRPPILLEPEGLRGDSAPRRCQAQIAPPIPARSTGGGGLGTDFDCDGGLIPEVSTPLSARDYKGTQGDGEGASLIAHALCAEGFDASEDGTGRGTPLVPVAFQSKASSVRRITPVEAERLQGFSDGYTKIPYRGKGADRCPDGPRYKALGNSMAVNVMRWIGERISTSNDQHNPRQKAQEKT